MRGTRGRHWQPPFGEGRPARVRVLDIDIDNYIQRMGMQKGNQ